MSPYGASRRPGVGFPIWEAESWALAVVGCGVREGLDEKGQGKGAPLPYHVSGYVRVSGAWIRARKLEGERDVGRHRIVCPTGESLGRSSTAVPTAEPAGPLNSTKFVLPIVGRQERGTLHRGRMVSLLFDIVFETV